MADIYELIQWFETADLPKKQFCLADHVLVFDPVRLYGSIRRAIKAGPTRASWKKGVLEGELKMLKWYCDKRGG